MKHCYGIDGKGYGFILLLILGLSSCGESDLPDHEKLAAPAHRYFELKDYFNQEIHRLGGWKRFEKKALVNGKEEVRTFDTLDMADELGVFLQSDINRPAWTHKYSIDSLWDANGILTRLTYQSLDKDLFTKRIVIDFEAGALDRIEIENSSKSTLANTRQHLEYSPNAGYIIENHQHVMMLQDQVFRVEVTFLP